MNRDSSRFCCRFIRGIGLDSPPLAKGFSCSEVAVCESLRLNGEQINIPLPPVYGERAFFTTTNGQRDCNNSNDSNNQPGVALVDLDSDDVLVEKRPRRHPRLVAVVRAMSKGGPELQRTTPSPGGQASSHLCNQM